MGEWMDRWMDGWASEFFDEVLSGWMESLVRMDGWVSEIFDEVLSGWMESLVRSFLARLVSLRMPGPMSCSSQWQVSSERAMNEVVSVTVTVRGFSEQATCILEKKVCGIFFHYPTSCW
jgi:hypothetical protein